MSELTIGETFIIFLLLVISYFLYHIAKQLSYLSGKRIRFRFGLPKLPTSNFKDKKVEEETKLPN